jgi:hypothetical protein
MTKAGLNKQIHLGKVKAIELTIMWLPKILALLIVIKTKVKLWESKLRRLLLLLKIL